MNSNINQPGEERGQAFLENLGRGKTIYEIEAEEVGGLDEYGDKDNDGEELDYDEEKS